MRQNKSLVSNQIIFICLNFSLFKKRRAPSNLPIYTKHRFLKYSLAIFLNFYLIALNLKAILTGLWQNLLKNHSPIINHFLNPKLYPPFYFIRPPF